LEKISSRIDLSKYRLITIFWNSLPMIFKADRKCFHVRLQVFANSNVKLRSLSQYVCEVTWI